MTPGPPFGPEVAGRYRARLAHRFDEVAGRARNSPAAGPRFEAAWAAWSGLPAAAGERVLGLPLLDAWVETAEHLAALGLFERYPEAHPARHLAELGRVVLAGVEVEAEGAAGTAALLGRPTLPLAGGRAVLAAAEPRDGVLEWRVEGGALRLALGGGEIGSVGLGGRLGEAELAPGWALRRLPEFGGVIADAGFPYDAAADRDGTGEGAGELEAVLARPLEQLAALSDGHPLRAVQAHLACVVPAREDHPRWVAGAARWPRAAPAGEAWLHLAFLALLDRAERLLRLTLPRDARAMLPAGVAHLAAWRLTDRLLGGRPDGGSEVARRWRRRARRIAGLPGGPALLEALGEEPGPAATAGEPERPGPAAARPEQPRPNGAGPEEPPPPAVTPLPALAPLAAWNDPPGAPFTLVKGRAGERKTLDWRALDRLAHADRARVAETLGSLGAVPAAAESDAYAQALCCYLLGRFDDVRRALAAALRLDAGVEEYWHLLAFSLRHLGDRAGFERIVFGGARDPALAGAAAAPGARG